MTHHMKWSVRVVSVADWMSPLEPLAVETERRQEQTGSPSHLHPHATTATPWRQNVSFTAESNEGPIQHGIIPLDVWPFWGALSGPGLDSFSRVLLPLGSFSALQVTVAISIHDRNARMG